jgi:hypothetical protein
MAILAKKALASDKEFAPVNLYDCRLEVYKYPRNCQAVVLAEFQGGHRAKTDMPKRPLRFVEWLYILNRSLNHNQIGDGRLGRGKVIHFSELKDQSTNHFSGLRLFRSLTVKGEAKGQMMEDDDFRYYQVKLHDELLKQINTAKKPESVSKGIKNGGDEDGFRPAFRAQAGL